MSSFNFSPHSIKSSHIQLKITCTLPLSPTSTLNPDASPYTPPNSPNCKSPLNATATPFTPKPTPNKTPCPSFAVYSQLNSSQIYNATCKYFERDTQYNPYATHSNSSIDTPIPASITSSILTHPYSHTDTINLIDIQPYVPKQTDIDQINNIIHHDTDSDTHSDTIHPLLTALTPQESNQLLQAPIWSPDTHSDHDTEIECSKIAIDEEDYQFILHPHKKPLKYGYPQAKIAKDHPIPPHIQYTLPHAVSGEKYDGKTAKIARDDISHTHTKPAHVQKINVAGVSNTNLYPQKTSRMAMEDITRDIMKIACERRTYHSCGESRMAVADIKQIAFIYCKT